jgi:hypothetical protein
VACLSTESLDKYVDSTNVDFPFTINRYAKGEKEGKQEGDDKDESKLCVTDAFFTSNRSVSFAIAVGSTVDYATVDAFINDRLRFIHVSEYSTSEADMNATMRDTRSGERINNIVSLKNNFKNGELVHAFFDVAFYGVAADLVDYGVVDAAINVFDDVTTGMKRAWVETVDGVDTAVSAVNKTLDMAVDTSKKAVDTVVTGAERAVDTAISAVDKTLDMAVDTSKKAVDTVVSGAKKADKAVKKVVKSLKKK